MPCRFVLDGHRLHRMITLNLSRDQPRLGGKSMVMRELLGPMAVKGMLPPGTSPRTAERPGERVRLGPERESTGALEGTIGGSSTLPVSCRLCLCRSFAVAALPLGPSLCSFLRFLVGMNGIDNHIRFKTGGLFH